MTAAQPDWFQRLNASPNPEDAADQLYKRVNQMLNERILHHRILFAEEGTRDFDAIKFVLATRFIETSYDPAIVAALAIAGIYRLARQGNS